MADRISLLHKRNTTQGCLELFGVGGWVGPRHRSAYDKIEQMSLLRQCPVVLWSRGS